jgi:DUF1680 family protein
MQSPTFFTLPLEAIRPMGWLERQLRLQADGLSGHLDEFWPDVKDSRWFGGAAEGWERAPYWLDGVLPLAYLLRDPALIAKVERYLDYIITHQGADGWLGPREMVQFGGQEPCRFYDIWATFLALKVLVQYHQAARDERALGAIERSLRQIDLHIDRSPLFAWGQFRWFEALIAIYYLYERRREPWLLDLAVKLHAQGFHWKEFFERWPLTGATPPRRWNFAGHVVNNSMALKGPGLWWRLTGVEADRQAVYHLIARLEHYHGMVTGVFSGDECLAGKSPIQGTELCAVVEYAFSLEVLLSLFGDPAFGDRLEKIVFNALPATFSPDMWAHQYDQQVNQVECSILPERTWTTNGPDANIFGLEPDYGCCTANLSQGWPKFAAHLWMRPADGGLAAVAYAPSRVAIEIDGTPVTVTLETEYPFRSELRFTVETAAAVRFPLLLRIPAWAAGASLTVAGAAQSAPQPGTFCRLEREWAGLTEVTLNLSMAPALLPGENGAVAIERGPLVYALPLGEDWRRVNADRPGRELPHADWEVYPTTPWNYALALSAAALSGDLGFREHPLGALPFSPAGAPVSLRLSARRLPGWRLVNGSAAPAPPSPVSSGEPLEEITLIPYGCTNLRMTEFPVLE